MYEFGMRNSELGMTPAHPSGTETETGTGSNALVSGRNDR
jgi:hypothetical protein